MSQMMYTLFGSQSSGGAGGFKEHPVTEPIAVYI
jgi:hypothetical protein